MITKKSVHTGLELVHITTSDIGKPIIYRQIGTQKAFASVVRNNVLSLYSKLNAILVLPKKSYNEDLE